VDSTGKDKWINLRKSMWDGKNIINCVETADDDGWKTANYTITARVCVYKGADYSIGQKWQDGDNDLECNFDESVTSDLRGCIYNGKWIYLRELVVDGGYTVSCGETADKDGWKTASTTKTLITTTTPLTTTAGAPIPLLTTTGAYIPTTTTVVPPTEPPATTTQPPTTTTVAAPTTTTEETETIDLSIQMDFADMAWNANYADLTNADTIALEKQIAQLLDSVLDGTIDGYEAGSYEATSFTQVL